MKKYCQKASLLLREYKQGVIAVSVFAVIGDILFITFKSDIITFTILALLIILFKFYKFPVRRVFILCIIPIIVIFFGFLFNSYSISVEKAAIWLFLLLGVGIIKQLFSKDKNETV